MKSMLKKNKDKLTGMHDGITGIPHPGLRGEISPDLRGKISLYLRGHISPRLRGCITGIYGDISPYLWGCITGIYGDCTGLTGDLDACEITSDDRANGVKIENLIA